MKDRVERLFGFTRWPEDLTPDIELTSYVYNMHQDTKSARFIAVCKRFPYIGCLPTSYISIVFTQSDFSLVMEWSPKNHAPVLEKISTKLLKDADNTISESLWKIFNLSLQQGIFPDDWKLARVSPIFKEDSKTECEN